jgi:hypothetical protein
MSVNIQGRIDLCSFATIAKAYRQRGYVATTKSDLMWRAVEDLAVLAEKSGVERFTSLEEALAYLTSIGLEIGTSTRVRGELYKDLVKQTGLAEYGSGTAFDSKTMTVGETSRSDRERMLLLYKQYKHDIGQNAVPFNVFVEEQIERDKFIQKVQKATRVTEADLFTPVDYGGKKVDRSVADEHGRVDPVAFQQKEAGKMADIKAALAMRPASVEATEEQASEVS